MKEINVPLPVLEGIKEDLDCQVTQFMRMNNRFDWLLRLLESDAYEAECRDERCREASQPALLKQLDKFKSEIGYELDTLEKHLFRLEQAIKIPRKEDVKATTMTQSSEL